MEDEAVPDGMTDQQDIERRITLKTQKVQKSRDDDIQDEVENGLEARWIHGRWAWLLA